MKNPVDLDDHEYHNDHDDYDKDDLDDDLIGVLKRYHNERQFLLSNSKVVEFLQYNLCYIEGKVT